MDLVAFSVVFIVVIFAVSGLAIWAVAKEEMRMQAARGMHASVPAASPSESATPDPSALVPVVVPAPVAQRAPLVPAP